MITWVLDEYPSNLTAFHYRQHEEGPTETSASSHKDSRREEHPIFLEQTVHTLSSKKNRFR